MKNKGQLVLMALVGLTSVTTGCARTVGGTWSGTTTLKLSSTLTGSAAATAGAPTAPMTVPLSLIIYPTSSTRLLGTWEFSGQSGSFQGTLSGDSITGVSLTLSGASSNSSGNNPAIALGLCNNLVGNLSLGPNNQLTGTLSVIQTDQTKAISAQSGYICTGTQSISANQTKTTAY